MAGWIAKRITQILVASAVVKEDDTELYIYGFFMLVSRILFLFVTVVTGFLTGILPESILFYVVFTLLRTYAGGVHAKTETACTIFTTFAIVVSVLLIRLLEIFAAGTVSFLILGIGSLCILAFSPLDTAEKPLKEQDKKRYRLATLITLMLCITTTLVARLWMLAGVFYSIVCGISLEGLLLALGMLQKCRKPSIYIG
jgi:membrane protein putatively involved in post-translational modification of the autoinducing quorum-sensing peptide